MKRGQSIKVFAGLRDLEIVDCAGELCGIADDVEFDGRAGGSLRIAAILVGPGAYGPRMPRVLAWAVRKLAGSGVVRIPWSAVEHVTSRITLNKTARELGLNATERRLAPMLKKVPFA